MSARPVAGTFRLDGMLQGPSPGGETVEDQMRDWIAQVADHGLIFHLAFEGGNFSMVADPSVRKWTDDQCDPGEALQEALTRFLEFLSPQERNRVFSTVRCEEFRPGHAVQSVLTISPEGNIEKAEREIDLETRSSGPDLSRIRLRRVALPLALILLLGGLLSTLVVDYGELFADARDRIMPLTRDEVTVDQGRLGDVFHLEISEIDREKSTLILEVSRGPGWDLLQESSPAETMSSWQSFLLAQALHRQRLKYDLFGSEDQFLGSGWVRLEGLDEEESIEVRMVARVSSRLARVSFYP